MTLSRKWLFIVLLYISDGAKKKAKWTPEEEEELRRVYEEYKDSGGETPFVCCSGTRKFVNPFGFSFFV